MKPLYFRHIVGRKLDFDYIGLACDQTIPRAIVCSLAFAAHLVPADTRAIRRTRQRGFAGFARVVSARVALRNIEPRTIRLAGKRSACEALQSTSLGIQVGRITGFESLNDSVSAGVDRRGFQNALFDIKASAIGRTQQGSAFKSKRPAGSAV